MSSHASKFFSEAGMAHKANTHLQTVSGRFFVSFVHPKTGKRIYAKDHGKKAFFIPDSNAKSSSKNGKGGCE